MPFEILRGDITKMRVDAIANISNSMFSAGTNDDIHRAADAALDELQEKIGNIGPVTCFVTQAPGIRAKCYLHALGPIWLGEKYWDKYMLRRAYDLVLQMAELRRCRSVAFPLRATDILYAIPRDREIAVAIEAFTDFLLEHEMQIYLVLPDGEELAPAGTLFDDLKNYIDENYADEYPAAQGGSKAAMRREEDALYHAVCCEEAAPLGDYSMAAQAPRRKERRAAKASVPLSGSLRDFLDQSESTFTEHLLDLLQEKNEKDSAVYHRAQMSRQLFNKIINKRDYQPTKNTAIQLAIGLRLDLPQTQKLLEKAGYALTRSSKSDLVVQYFIQHGDYSIVAINTALYDCGLPLLTRE